VWGEGEGKDEEESIRGKGFYRNSIWRPEEELVS
jgi:hypothetical protein